jgi:hypothetical protein
MMVDGIECGVDARVLHVPLLRASCHQLLCGITMDHFLCTQFLQFEANREKTQVLL